MAHDGAGRASARSCRIVHGAPTADVLDYLFEVESAAPSLEESRQLWGEIQAAAARLARAERGVAEALG